MLFRSFSILNYQIDILKNSRVHENFQIRLLEEATKSRKRKMINTLEEDAQRVKEG